MARRRPAAPTKTILNPVVAVAMQQARNASYSEYQFSGYWPGCQSGFELAELQGVPVLLTVPLTAEDLESARRGVCMAESNLRREQALVASCENRIARLGSDFPRQQDLRRAVRQRDEAQAALDHARKEVIRIEALLAPTLAIAAE